MILSFKNAQPGDRVQFTYHTSGNDVRDGVVKTEAWRAKPGHLCIKIQCTDDHHPKTFKVAQAGLISLER